jgi:hypothetical protein
MTKLFLTDNKTLERRIKQTVSAYGMYRFKKGQSGSRNSILIQRKGIVLEYKILSFGNRSKLFISAMSPYCIITKSYQDIWEDRFLHDLETLPNSPAILYFAFQKVVSLINFFVRPALKL